MGGHKNFGEGIFGGDSETGGETIFCVRHKFFLLQTQFFHGKQLGSSGNKGNKQSRSRTRKGKEKRKIEQAI